MSSSIIDYAICNAKICGKKIKSVRIKERTDESDLPLEAELLEGKKKQKKNVR